MNNIIIEFKINNCLLGDFLDRCDYILLNTPLDYDITSIVLSRNISKSIIDNDKSLYNITMKNLKAKDIITNNEDLELFLYEVMNLIKFKSEVYNKLQKHNLHLDKDNKHNNEFELLYKNLRYRGKKPYDDEILYYFILNLLETYLNNNYKELARLIDIIEETFNISPTNILYKTIEDIKYKKEIRLKSNKKNNLLF